MDRKDLLMKHLFFSTLLYCASMSVAADKVSDSNGFFLGAGLGLMDYQVLSNIPEGYISKEDGADLSEILFLGYQFNDHYGTELTHEESSQLFDGFTNAFTSIFFAEEYLSTQTDVLNLMGYYQTTSTGLYGKVLGGFSRISQKNSIEDASSNHVTFEHDVNELEVSAGLAAGFQTQFGFGLELKYVWYSTDVQSVQANLRYKF